MMTNDIKAQHEVRAHKKNFFHHDIGEISLLIHLAHVVSHDDTFTES